MLLVVSLLFVLLLAALGLALGTLRADLHWTNETAPIKQSVAVMLTLLLGWVLALIPGGGYLLLSGQISLPVWLALVAAAYGLAAALLLVWLKTDGARRFAALR